VQALLLGRAQALAEQSGLTPEVVRAMATLQRLAEPPPANPPVATASLVALSYTDADNWFMRTLQASAADETPDANGRIRYHDVRVASAAPNAASAPLPGIVRGWALGNVQSRAGDLHWNGSAWVGCTLTDRFQGTQRDSLGRSSYDFCNQRETGLSQRRLEDISGQPMADVVAGRIRSFPGNASGVSYANWGPADLGLYGSATFPAGSVLQYHSNTVLTTAFGYDVTAPVTVWPASVAAGGDARITPTLDCNNPTLTAVGTGAPATSLEELINRNRGTPCITGQVGATPNFSLDPNETWFAASANLGILPNIQTQPGGTGSYYTTTAGLRVSFTGSGNRVLFHRCYMRQVAPGVISPRNCSTLGLGSYTVQTLGDARVMSFSVAPALAQRLGYERVFVERGGVVYHGFKLPVGGATLQVRLNQIAANALLEQLGLPRIRPVTQPGTATGTRAANLATLQGVWGANDATTATVFRFGPDGRFFMAEGKPALANPREQSGSELGWFDHDPATGAISTLLELDSNLSSGTSHPQAGDPPLVITPSALSVGATTINRLGNDANGLVGLWAVTSATDLSVPHLAFFANGRVLFVDPAGGDTAQCTATGEGPPGAEYASWSYDAALGELTISGKIHDSNGCAGLFDSSALSVAVGTDNIPVVFNLSFAPDRLTMQLGGTRGSNETWFRIPVQ
jgi:hypothetical protein